MMPRAFPATARQGFLPLPGFLTTPQALLESVDSNWQASACGFPAVFECSAEPQS